ncbi:MAG: ABC transporter ATP-binding protein [Rhodospirillaceae bacterium]|jgi:lipoprotein-releasing system ATP-binding protein|nr:ABC transporter ATP-binding protein [Rhodospirillaceae bacterium]MBT5666071.1 ABC transporter ATP-binding protein [Rhodospirillaceae bacterium]MBT5808821.1 ABC transporter ATP-binding protein [Rhodospirillaceae bacterium]
MSEPQSSALVLDGVVRTYRFAEHALEVLRGASLSIATGELVGLVGPSGSGKSTLLHIAGLLEWPDGGEVQVAGRSCQGMNDKERTLVRRNDIGFVYQFHHLLPEFSALENVMLPLMISGVRRSVARTRARDLIDAVGLSDREAHRPARLSGGEQQRVALARALANEPRVLLADEPTGNLDVHTSAEVFELLMSLVRATKLSALVATHNLDLADKMDRIIRLDDGRLTSD